MGKNVGDRSSRLAGLTVVLVVVAALVMVPRPALAHDGHAAVALASDQAAGPFVVSVWLVGNTITGMDDLHVVVRDGANPRKVEAVDNAGEVMVFEPSDVDRVWVTTLTGSSTEANSLEISLQDDTGLRGVLAVSTLAPSVPGMNWIVLAFLAQAAITLGWLVWRGGHVWSRERRPMAMGVIDS